MDDYHLFQVVEGGSVDSGAGKDLNEGIVGQTNDLAILLPGIGLVDLELLYFGIIDDKSLTIGAVHGGVGEECQFHDVAELLAIVRMKRVAFGKFLVFRLVRGPGECRDEQAEAEQSEDPSVPSVYLVHVFLLFVDE